jgi:hypothetical protein
MHLGANDGRRKRGEKLGEVSSKDLSSVSSGLEMNKRSSGSGRTRMCGQK